MIKLINSRKNKPKTIKITYKPVGTPEEQQKAMDDVFDFIYSKTLESFNPKKRAKSVLIGKIP